MHEIDSRITVNPEQCGGRPCIRGMRIRVTDILDLLAAGLSHAEIVEELPDLELEDVRASVRYASRRIDRKSRVRTADSTDGADEGKHHPRQSA